MWVFYALLSALCLASIDAVSKHLLQDTEERIVAWGRFLFAVPFLAGLLFFISIPPLDASFWTAIAVMLPLEISALFIYVRAIKLSPLSLTLPFLSLTPVFLVVIGWLILGERVDFKGGTGIGLIVCGAYALHLHTFREGWFHPFRAIIHEAGSRLMILVAFLYSITSSLGKLAILHASPASFALIYVVVLAVALSPIVSWTARRQRIQITAHAPAFLGIGLLQAAMIFFHALALSQAHVAYMISAKRTSLLFGILYGHFLFQEDRLRQRLGAGVLMLAGVVLISL